MRQLMQVPLCAPKFGINVRFDPGEDTDLRNLGDSWLKNPIEPISLREDMILLNGSRRVRGARLLLGENSEHPVPALIGDEPIVDSDIPVVNLLSAIHTKDLTGGELWQGYLALELAHPEWLGKDFAKALSVDPSWITQIKSPSLCSLAWQEALLAGKVTLTACYQTSKVAPELHDALLAEKLKSKGGRRGRNDPAQSTQKSRRVTIPIGTGQVVLTGTSLDLQGIVTILQNLLCEAKRAAGKAISIGTWQKLMADKAKAVS